MRHIIPSAVCPGQTNGIEIDKRASGAEIMS